MTMVSSISREDMINCLLRGKFKNSRWINWFFVKKRGLEEQKKEHNLFKQKLKNLPDDELETLFIEQRNHFKLTKQNLEYYNSPDYDANFQYWVKKAYWTIDEAISLFFGIEPGKTSQSSLERYALSLDFADVYGKFFDLVKRAKISGILYTLNTPFDFCNWAQKMGIDAPQELLEQLEAHGIAMQDWQKCCITLYKQLEEKEKNIAKLETELAQHINKPPTPNIDEKTACFQCETLNALTATNAVTNHDQELIYLLRFVLIMMMVDDRSETTYLNIIGGLLALIKKTAKTKSGRTKLDTQENIINELVDLFPNNQGIKQRTLAGKFSKASKSLKSYTES